MFIRLFRIYVKVILAVMLVAVTTTIHIAIAPINLIVAAVESLYATIKFRDESNEDVEEVIETIRDARHQLYSETLETCFHWIYE